MTTRTVHLTMLILISTLILAGGSFYIAWRLVGPFAGLSAGYRIVWLMVMSPALYPTLLLILKINRMEIWFDRLLAFSFIITGWFSFLLVLALGRDGILIFTRMVTVLAGKIIPACGVGGSSWAGVTAGWQAASNMWIWCLSLLLLGIGMVQAFREPSIKTIPIKIDALPQALNGFRIVQLSDIHLDVMTRAATLEKIVNGVNRIQPDITVITGDLVDGSVKKRGEDARVLSRITSPIYFVNGNHEYYFGAEAWNRYLTSLGIVVLNSESKIVRVKDARLMIAGIPDLSVAGRFNGPSVVKLPEPGGVDVSLLLSHQPAAAFMAAEMGYDLQLSGHTHGGQFFPWNMMIRYVQPFSKGLYRYKGMWIYTSQGTGFWGPPIRLGAPQEITLITLTR